MADESSNEPDPRTLARFKGGDITALAAVFRSYGPQVYRLARRMMGNRADAEDAVQEIFVRAHQKGGQFDGRSSLYTWLYRLAVRHCLNKIKQRKRRESHERAAFVPDEASAPGSAPSPVVWLSEQEQSEILNALLHSLPASHRACLVLRELEGLSYAQIAELTGIPIGTVMSRLARARAALRRSWQRYQTGAGTGGNNSPASVVEAVTEQMRDELC